MAKGIRKSAVRRLLTGTAVVLIGLVIPLTPPGRMLEKAALDLFFILRGARTVPEGVVIVAIDEASFAEVGKRWPWPRSLYGALTARLADQGARAIGFDILFVEPDRAEEDEAFASAIEGAGNVVLAGDLVEESGPWGERLVAVEPHPLLKRGARGVGLVSLGVDEDHFIRATRLTFAGRPGFSLELARVSGWAEKVGAVSGEDLLHIDYVGPAGAVPTVSFYQALDPESHLPPRFFRDRVVLVGLVLGATPDPEKRRPDAYPVPFSRWGGALMSGVEIHANVLLNLFERKRLLPVKGAGLVLLTVFFGIGISTGMTRFPPLAGLAAGAIAGGAWLAGAYGLFSWKGWCLPLISPLIQIATAYGGNQALAYIAKERETRWLRRAFSSYLSPAVAAEVLDHPDKLRLGGERIEGTVLFADLAGFTALSEALSPESPDRPSQRLPGRDDRGDPPPRRHARQVHGGRRHGFLGRARGPGGSCPAGLPGGRQHAGADGLSPGGLAGEGAPRSPLPHRYQLGSDDRRERGIRDALRLHGDRRHGQPRGAARETEQAFRDFDSDQ